MTATLWVVIVLGALALLLLAWLVLRPPRGHDDLKAALEQLAERVAQGDDRLERSLRSDISDSAQRNRDDLRGALSTFQQTLLQQQGEANRTQNSQLDSVAQQLQLLQKNLSDTLTQQLKGLADSNDKRLAEVRATVEQRLRELQSDNEKKLEQMRQTVDEKLHATLEQRLGESFKQVAERLEQVHRGLGEMQTLAQGVGDLKRVLTNVKSRGVFGEVQLAALLEQVFTTEQYATNIATVPGSNERVEFAIRLPGRADDGAPLWLPIDAKFPREDYERLLDAQERADAPAAEAASKMLEQRLRLEARAISEKYVAPPHTTDFAVMFLPTEGLYAEALRRPGLMDALQRDHRVTVTGPTTLLAMLTSLQMGFRTLALEKRSSEVWKLLEAVKTEFGKFGDVLARVKSQAETMVNTIDKAETRTRAMARVLKGVDALPGAEAAPLLGLDDADGGEGP
ncbi:MAG: DNA recombination protein RmuC [Betaproteobacteria bacterium]|nr:DNA recombination protein RmuC [Betaproteobacteria bacterium]